MRAGGDMADQVKPGDVILKLSADDTVRRVRQAVEDPSDYVYVHTVHGMGYRFEPVLKTDMAEAARS